MSFLSMNLEFDYHEAELDRDEADSSSLSRGIEGHDAMIVRELIKECNRTKEINETKLKISSNDEDFPGISDGNSCNVDQTISKRKGHLKYKTADIQLGFYFEPGSERIRMTAGAVSTSGTNSLTQDEHDTSKSSSNRVC